VLINTLITRMSLVFQLPDNMTGTLICINTWLITSLLVQIHVQITTITKRLVNNDVPQQVKSWHNDTTANH